MYNAGTLKSIVEHRGKSMFITDELYNSTLATEAWLTSLHNSHNTRALFKYQVEQFYFKRRAVEYGVKTTITASLATSLSWGGPPFWIIGGAALILKITTLCLYRFNPSQYVEDSSYHPKSHPKDPVDLVAMEDFRFRWLQNHQNYLFDQNEKQLCFLQKRIAFALAIGFVIFTFLNASLTIPIILTSLIYAAALIEQTKEEQIPYIEEENQLSL